MNFSSENNILFKTLLTDPEKRAKILQLLTQEGLVSNSENVSPNIKKRQPSPKNRLLNNLSLNSKVNKVRLESPSALGRRRALEQLQTDSSSESSSSPPPPPSRSKVKSDSVAGKQLPFDELLKGVTAYCEVRSNGEDRSTGIKTMMRAMGATIREHFTRDVTHVIFKDGLYSTFRKAQNLKIHVVSVLWLDAVRKHKMRVPESKYRALGVDGLQDVLNESFICQEMQKEYDEVLKDEKRKRSELRNKSLEKKSEISNQEDVPEANDKINRTTLATPYKYRCTSPVYSESDSCDEFVDNNGDKDIVPSSQTQSTFTTPATTRKSTRKIKEKVNDDNTEKNLSKLVKDSFELKKVQKIKSPESKQQQTVKVRTENESSLSEESLRLHITTTDESVANITTKSLSSNFAQKIDDNIITGTDLKGNSILNSSVDSVNAGIVNKTRKTKSIGLTRNRRKTNIGLINILENSEQIQINSVQEVKTCENVITKPKVRKIYNNKQFNELFFNWDAEQVIEQPEKFKTPPRKGKYKVTIPKDFPKTLSAKARSKVASTTKKCATIAKIQTDTISNKKKSSRSLNFENCDTNKKEKSPEINRERNVTIRVKTTKINKEIDSTKSQEKDVQISEKKNTESENNSSSKQTSVASEEIPKLISPPTTRNSTRILSKSVKVFEMNTEETPTTEESTINITLATSESSDHLTKLINTNVKKPLRRKSTRINSNSEIDNKEQQPSPPKRAKRKTICTTSYQENESFTSCNTDISIPTSNKKQTRKNILNSEESETSFNTTQESESSATSSQVTKKNSRKSTFKVPTQIKLKTPKTNEILQTPKRRSTLEFVSRENKTIQSTQKIKNTPRTPTIVCTRFHKSDVQDFEQIVKKLGGFVTEDEVTKRTTHLVCNGLARTINILRAITRGCWILRKEWLYRSLEAEKWLDEEDYELTEFSTAVQKCRLEKQTFGSMFCMDIFKQCGLIYISRASTPRYTDLEELVDLCGGQITRNITEAQIIIGEQGNNNDVVCVTEKWILDSITQNKKKTFKHYVIVDDSP